MAYAKIRTSGKFEGELEIVPRMYDFMVDGLSRDVWVDDTMYSFVTLEDIGERPQDGLYGAMLYEDDLGFVYACWYGTKERFDAKIAKLEALVDSDGDE